MSAFCGKAAGTVIADTVVAITDTTTHFGSRVIKHTVTATIVADIPVVVDFSVVNTTLAETNKLPVFGSSFLFPSTFQRWLFTIILQGVRCDSASARTLCTFSNIYY